MNTGDIIKAVAKKTGFTQAVASEIMNATLEVIRSGVQKDQRVKLTGFGTFEVVKRAARRGRNPQNGNPVKIPASAYPKFRTSKVWKDKVNKK